MGISVIMMISSDHDDDLSDFSFPMISVIIGTYFSNSGGLVNPVILMILLSLVILLVDFSNSHDFRYPIDFSNYGG